MLVLKAKPAEPLRLHGCGDEMTLTLIEIRRFDVRVQLLHAGVASVFTMSIEDPLVIRIDDVDVAVRIERILTTVISWSFEAPPVIRITRIAEPVAV